MKGKTVSHYRVLEKIGEGGMGIVYKAEDTKLKRNVTLKFLHKELTREEDAKTRFIQEARAAARLDHANICSVFEIGQTEDGQLFIAMAFYDGETLKDKIKKGPLKIKEVLDITNQIAHGLKKAHENGIVHRDVKPANILITRDNVVKILDFGLAKLKGQTKLTKNGTTLGTVAYMSPEQAQGEKVDHRTDIWSLGVILYEMISGQLPFKGEYEQAIMYAIMNEEPEPLTALRTDVPIKLDEIVKKLLSKGSDQRYQHVDELPVDLKNLHSKSERPPKKTTRKLPFWHKPLLWQFTTLIAVFVAIFALLSPGPTTKIPVPINSLKITTATGVEDYPSWSPEGKRLAYHSNQNGNYDVWVTQVNGSQPQNRTQDYSGNDMFPVWSHNGDFIAFWSDRNGGSYYIMPALGGPVTKLIFKRNPFPGIAQWSADDTKLACVTKDTRNNYWIEIIDYNTVQALLELRVPNKDNIYDLSWSPDGQSFAYVDAPDRSWDASQIFILKMSNKQTFPVTDGMTNNWNPSWSKDSQYLFYVSNRWGSMDLWQQNIKSDGSLKDSPVRITAAVGIRSAAWSSDYSRLAFSRGKSILNVWTVPILENRMASDENAIQITFYQAFTTQLDISRDGEWLYFTSDIKGNNDIWKMRIKSGELIQLTKHPAPDWHPRISPDGEQISFHSNRSGNRDIWIISTDGGPARKVTEHPASDLWPDWSPDGQEIVFTSTRSGNRDIWKKSLKDNSLVQLTTDPADDSHPIYCTDGNIYFKSTRKGLIHLWRISANGENPEQISKESLYFYGCNKKTNTFYFFTYRDRKKNIWELSVNTRIERRLTDFGDKLPGLMESNTVIAPDNKHLFFCNGGKIGDIYVMDFEKREK